MLTCFEQDYVINLLRSSDICTTICDKIRKEPSIIYT